MNLPSSDLTELTVVLGPPTQLAAVFADFQQRAAAGEPVSEHAWAQHEYAALDALTLRDGSVKVHTLLETMLSSVLGAEVLVLDVDRSWVRAEDGQLYVALSMCSLDIRSRADVGSLSAPAFLEALNDAAVTIAQLDGREWIRWSSRPWRHAQGGDAVSRAAQLVTRMAEAVLGDSAVGAAPTADDTPIDLTAELVRAVTLGRDAASNEGAELSQELRALRVVDPLRTEWVSVTADALYVGALDVAVVRQKVSRAEAAGLAFLYLGAARTEQLKQNTEITPRFRRELLAKTFMTSYALERLAPRVAYELLASMRGE